MKHLFITIVLFALDFQEVGGGRAEQEGTFFLLPYYMARYHKIIK